MQIVPKAGPNVEAPRPEGPSDHQKAQQRRANAIAALQGKPTGTQSAQQIVQNANQVSPEEMTAVKPSSVPEQIQEVTEESRQSTISEESVQTSPTEVSPKKEESPLSRQFAQLAKQEKLLRAKALQQDQAIKAKEAEIAAREAALAAKEQEYQTNYIPKDRLKTNTLQALADAEISYDELTRQLMESATPMDPRVASTIAKLEAKIQSLETASEESQKSFKSTQQQAYDAAVKQIKAEVSQLVQNDPNYETIKATGSSKDVVDLIVRTFNEDGVLLSVEEAANEVENYILEEAIKLSKLSKVAKKVQASASPKPQAIPPTQPTQSQTPGIKTLTNKVASTRQLTARERAILAFKGEMK